MGIKMFVTQETYDQLFESEQNHPSLQLIK